MLKIKKEKKIIKVLFLMIISLVLYYLLFFINLYIFNYRFIDGHKDFSLAENTSIHRINHAKSINFYLETFNVFGCHYCSYNNSLISYKFNNLINNATDNLEISLLELEFKKYKEIKINSSYETKKYDELVYQVLDDNLYNDNVNNVYIAYMANSINLYLNHVLDNKENLTNVELVDKLNRLIKILNNHKNNIQSLDILRYRLNSALTYYIKNNKNNPEMIKIMRLLEDF